MLLGIYFGTEFKSGGGGGEVYDDMDSIDNFCGNPGGLKLPSP